MIYTELTKRAIRIAYDAHAGAFDRGNVPDICHPLHLAEEMPDETKTAIALLHDVLEDTDLTAEDLLREGIPAGIVEAVKILTRDKAENSPFQRLLSGKREKTRRTGKTAQTGAYRPSKRWNRRH